MSQDDAATHARAAPAMGAAPDPARSSRPAPPARRGGGASALALLLALLAIAGVAYVAWRQGQERSASAQALRATAKLEERMNSMVYQLASATGQDHLLLQRLNDADQANRSLRETLLAHGQRMGDLEAAVSTLAEKMLSGQDAMRLDETEFLLRMGAQRYQLFHDTSGAAQAFALASQALAGVSDPAFKGVRQQIDAERDALLQSQAVDPQPMLNELAQLRSDLPRLPLQPLDAPAVKGGGVWTRIKRAFYVVVHIKRDHGAPVDMADARLARELVGLDLAQAQAAWLAWDNEAAAAALQRAGTGLAAQFDAQSPVVRQAQQRIAGWLAWLKPAAPVPLGTALAELRHGRAVHALKPNLDNVVPGKGAQP